MKKQNLSDIEIRFAEKYRGDYKFRLISQGGSGRTQDEEWKIWFDYLVFIGGWRFDQVDRTWKPPEDPPIEPKSIPIPMNEFKILSGSKFALESGEVIELKLSFSHNPYFPVIRWLEQIIRGESTRAFIDGESRYLELISYSKEKGKIRFIINYYTGSSEETRETMLDALVPRRAVIEEFYHYIIDIFCASSPEEFWENQEKCQSDLIEDFLNNH